MYKHWPDFVLKEIAFVEQRQLFDRLADQLGEAPPVIDSDDLLEDPGGHRRGLLPGRGHSLHPRGADAGSPARAMR